MITNSLEQQSKIRSLLEANGIDYKVDMGNYGSYIGSENFAHINYIYVRRKDYEKADSLIAA